MQTDLSLNGHHLRDPVHYIYGSLNKNKRTFLLNGLNEIMFPFNIRLLSIKVLICNAITHPNPLSDESPYPIISLKINYFLIRGNGNAMGTINLRSTKASKI